MAYNNNNKRYKRQEQDDNNLPQVFQRLGNISRPFNNNRNNSNNRTQRYDGGLRIARYNNSTQRTFPDYGKIGQLSDEAIYYSPNNNNDYTYSPPSITNPTTTSTSNFRFVRNDSQKDMSRPIISFLRDTPTSNGPISPSTTQSPTQPAAHNNNDAVSNTNNSNFNHYNMHPMNNRRVINTEEHYHHQQNEKEVSRRRRVEEEEELDERTSYNNRINIEIAKKIQITASIPPSSTDNNTNVDTNNEMSSSNLDNPILTSKRKVTLTSSEKDLDTSHYEKRSSSNSSSNRSTTRRSSPSSRTTRRSRSPRTNRSRSRSPRTKRNRSPSSPPARRRPRHSSELSYDTDDEVPFLNLKGDKYLPRYTDNHEKRINHRLTGPKKFKELRSYPPLSQLPTKGSHHKTWVKSTAPAIENHYPLPSSKKFTGVTNTTVNVTPNNTRNHLIHNTTSSSNSSVNTVQKPMDLNKPTTSDTTSITTILTQSVNTSNTTTANTTTAITSTKPDNTATTTNTTTPLAINTSVKPTSKTQSNLSTINIPVYTASNLLANPNQVKPVSFVVKTAFKPKIIHNNNNSPAKEGKAPTGSIDAITTSAQLDETIQFGSKETVVGSNMNDATPSLQPINNGLHVNDIRHDENQNDINNKNTIIQLDSDTSVHQATVKKGIENESNHSTVIKNTTMTTPAIPSGSQQQQQQQDTMRIASNHDTSSTITVSQHISEPSPPIHHPSSTTSTATTTQNVLSKKGEKAMELLRQLGIDERDDVVMDIVPLIRNTDGITSPSILKNHFNNLCKQSDIPVLKQEPLPDTTIPEQPQDSMDTHHGLVQDPPVDELMRSSPVAAESLLISERNKLATKLPEIDTQKAVFNSPPLPSPIDSHHHQLISPPVSSTTETPPISLPTIKPRIKTTQKTGRLPPPWKVRMNDSGDIYYLNTKTGEETSTRPV